MFGIRRFKYEYRRFTLTRIYIYIYIIGQVPGWPGDVLEKKLFRTLCPHMYILS